MRCSSTGKSTSSRVGISMTVPFRALFSRLSHLGRVTTGASSPSKPLNLTEERLFSRTSITSPGLT
ncbi:hypothetical protein EVA_13375 [gut metagenome]|uniref:Uncharacterized protein n=1 Tax=gut metagenome TaxID=749906 RepID=J9GGL9_9ZZZZ